LITMFHHYINNILKYLNSKFLWTNYWLPISHSWITYQHSI